MRETLTCTASDGSTTRYVLDVSQEEDHWVSTLSKLTPDGQIESAKVAPKFYGTTTEQARRRMISVLENQYEDVRISQ